jgi:hypothetical protein
VLIERALAHKIEAARDVFFLNELRASSRVLIVTSPNNSSLLATTVPIAPPAMATIKDGTGTYALAAYDKSALLQPYVFGRPLPGPNDVQLDIWYCGMCHSDLHSCNGDWGVESFPVTPGHEIAGVVST